VNLRLDRSITVFMLHDVGGNPSPFTSINRLWVSEAVFRTQIEFVAENFNVISAEALLKGEIPKRAAMITFDDGYDGTFRYALPIMSDMKLPSTVFMNLSPVSGDSFWTEQVTYLCQNEEGFQRLMIERGASTEADVHQASAECTPELVHAYELEHGDAYKSELEFYRSRYVSPEDLAAADSDSLVTFGNHLYCHYNVKNLSNDLLREQYQKNAESLTGFNRYLPIFAFPYGHPGRCFTAAQVSYLLQLGALRVFSTWPRPNTDHSAKLMDRVALTSDHDTTTRLWLQVVKFPILETLGKGRPAVEWPIEISDYRPK